MKLFIKKIAILISLFAAPYLPSRRLRNFFCIKIAPFLMDSRVLPRGLAIRPARLFGVDVLCDPYIHVHQSYYWCGIFFEEEIENYILRELKPGDTLIDVGMNVGHVSIPAAKLVGSRGKVISFEPNLDIVKRVESLANQQKLTQLTVKPFGLGKSQGVIVLNMDSSHTGGATFRNPSPTDEFNTSMEVNVKVGDEILCQEKLPGKVLMKMDVEGFEIDALKGLKKTLQVVDHAIIEISPEWLKSEGLTELSTIMETSGFASFFMTNDGKVGKSVRLENIVTQANILFIRK